MKMVRLILILTIIIFASCGHSDKTAKTADSNSSQNSNSENDKKINNALSFINSYVENTNKMKQAVGIIDWVNSNNLSTKGFKKELKRIIEEAYKNDPELGIEADPIFDAQDNPSKGFALDSYDEKTNYLTLKGIDMPDFKLTMKIKNENGNWLVDGCGMVNIPNDKRAER